MFHVVLFEPEIPPNTGNAIRLCANAGATLHLVKPLDFRDLAEVKVHADLDACLCELAAARVMAVETTGRRCYADISYRTGDALLFGPETRGLPDSVQERIGRENSLFIPMRARNRSLNLSNAVAVVAYEAWRQLRFASC